MAFPAVARWPLMGAGWMGQLRTAPPAHLSLGLWAGPGLPPAPAVGVESGASRGHRLGSRWGFGRHAQRGLLCRLPSVLLGVTPRASPTQEEAGPAADSRPRGGGLG